MKFKRILLFVFMGLASLLLTGCSGAPLTNWPGLASDGENVYLSNGQHVYTVRASNGQESTTITADGEAALRFPIKADGNMTFYGAPALLPSGQMVVGNASSATNVHDLYSVDPANSVIKWTFSDAKGIWIAGAAVGTDAIYAVAGDGKVYAVDFKGQKLWETSVSTDALWSTPVTDGRLIYVATLSHHVVALDPATGKQRWTIGLDNAIIGPPAVGDGKLYVGTLSGNLYAIDATEGSQVWLTKLQGSIWATPTLDGDTLYIGTSNETAGKFYAINTADGKTVLTLDDTGAIVASPLVTDSIIVYVTEEGFIKFLEKSGSPYAAPVHIENAKIYTTPILVGDLIVVAPMNAQFILAAYNFNGVQQWAFTPK